jgi:hypothetical protein
MGIPVSKGASKMTDPSFNKDELWESLRRLSEQKRKVHALKFNDNYHTITALDEERRIYSILFRSQKSHEISFDTLYILYTELYKNGWIDSNYMAQHSKRLYNKPYITNGTAMLAEIYHCDRNVVNTNGMLSLKKN